MRNACLDCVYKHLSAAAVVEGEFVLGYPKLKLYIVGNLDQAAVEAFKVSSKLAWVIRQHRLNWCTNPMGYDIPYEDLGYYAEMLKALPDGAELELPESCVSGLAKTAEGVLIFDMDTRP